LSCVSLMVLVEDRMGDLVGGCSELLVG
jgi:hypothetical protein